MAILIEIQTDFRVRMFLDKVLRNGNLKLLNEIDSVNYGEGYSLEYKGVGIRLYDDERSEKVMIDDDFKSGNSNWDETFEKIAQKMKGTSKLKIEIDRYNASSHIKQDEVKDLLTRLIEKSGFKFSIKQIRF